MLLIYESEGLSMENEEQRRRKDVYEADFMEETAAEVGVPYRVGEPHAEREVIDIDRNRNHEVAGRGEGTGYGRFALVLSILSLFFLPIILGAAGIILGFIARRKGALTLGSWAIGIGVVSIIVGTFILPFFS